MPRPQDWMKPTPHVRIDAGGEEATLVPGEQMLQALDRYSTGGELAELARKKADLEVKRVETQTLRMETEAAELHARQLALAAPPHQGGGEANAMVAVFQGMVAAADRRADALEAEMNRMRDTAAQEQARYNREQIEELKAERNRAVAVDPLTSFFTLLEKLPQARQAMDAVSPTASPVPSGVTDPHVLIETLRIQREGSLQQQKMNIDLQESQHRRRLEERKLDAERARTDGLLGQLDKATGMAAMFLGGRVDQAMTGGGQAPPPQLAAPDVANDGVTLVKIVCPHCGGTHTEPSDRRLTVCPETQQMIWMVPPGSSLEEEQARAAQAGVVTQPVDGQGPPGWQPGPEEDTGPVLPGDGQYHPLGSGPQSHIEEPTWYGGGSEANGQGI